MKFVIVNIREMLLLFERIIDTHEGIVNATDDDDNWIVPVERFDDFCTDIGQILGKTVEKVHKLVDIKDDEEDEGDDDACEV